MKVTIKFGRSAKGGKGKLAFSGTDNFGVDEFETALNSVRTNLINETKRKIQDIGDKKITRILKIVQNDLRKDLINYASFLNKFFFNQKTPSRETSSLKIDVLDQVGSSRNPFTTYYRGSRQSLIWKALSNSTQRKKKGNRLFFIQTGELQQQMQKLLPELLVNLLSPVVKYTPKTNKNTQSELSINLATRSGRTPEQLGLLNIELTGPSEDSFVDIAGNRALKDTLIKRYVGQQVWTKLMNTTAARNGGSTGSTRATRPWVEPAITWWAIRQYPVRVGQSLMKNLNIKGF